jgi:hypothetical protein
VVVRKLVVAALLAAALAPASAPAAEVKPVRVGPNAGGLLPGDPAALAFVAPGGDLRVLRDAGREMRVPLNGCMPLAMHMPYVLLDCTPPPASLDPHDAVLNVGTRKVAPVPASPAGASPPTTGYGPIDFMRRIGSQWVGGIAYGGRFNSHRVWVNWRDGRRVEAPAGGNPDQRDLNTRELRPFPPTACLENRDGDPPQRWYAGYGESGSPLRVHDCMTGAFLELASCARTCFGPAIGPRAIAWSEPGKLHVRDMVSGRRLRAGVPADRPWAPAVTSQYAYFASSSVPWRAAAVYRIPLPKR